MTNNEAIGILAIIVETAKGRCFVTNEAISDAYAMAIKALEPQELSKNSPKLDKENGDLQPTCNQLATVAKDTNVLHKDTISRQDALDAIGKCTDIYVNNLPIMIDKAEVYKALNEVPSAEQIVRCKYCKYCDRGIDEDGNPFLKCLGWVYGGTQEEDFCSHAERRTDDIQ